MCGLGHSGSETFLLLIYTNNVASNCSNPKLKKQRKFSLTKIKRYTVRNIMCSSHYNIIPYSLKVSRIKYFVVWLNSAHKQNFADKIFVVERESCKVHTYVYNNY